MTEAQPTELRELLDKIETQARTALEHAVYVMANLAEPRRRIEGLEADPGRGAVRSNAEARGAGPVRIDDRPVA